MFTIGVDLRPTIPGFKAHYGRGTGRYTSEVTRQLIGYSDENLSIVPLDSDQLVHQAWEERLVRLSPLGKITLETQLLLPRRLSRLDVDMVHFFSHGDAPARSKKRYIVTVLDLIPLRFAELYKADKPSWRFRLARFLELQAIRRAHGIIAISDCTKRDLVEILGVDPDRIAVTHLGVDKKFRPRTLERAELEASLSIARRGLGLELGRPILLYVGGVDPRKNSGFLLRAFKAVLQSWVGDRKPLLCIAGDLSKERDYPKLLAEKEKLGLGDDVRELGYLSDEQLLQAYHSASLVLFPSLYEGFGLPVLEAMSCGVPVLAASNSSIPEVTGEAIPLLPDNDLNLWVREILSILSSTERQLMLGRIGYGQSRLFSWERTARQTLDAYRLFLDLPRDAEVPSAEYIAPLQLRSRDEARG